MPIKDFEKFESYFFDDGKFNKKIYESYWDDDQDEYYNNDDDDDYDWLSPQQPADGSNMLKIIKLDKLKALGLNDYDDVARKLILWAEDQIARGAFGDEVIPNVQSIRRQIKEDLGPDYKELISDDDLDLLSQFCYDEIDNYVF